MAEISAIVPVYKVENYLSRCVFSILNQTFADFELILVDDGSPDRCGEMCDEYAKTDSRIVVIHQKNGGLSAARNAGIDWAFKNSDSKWITFIDSDDWVDLTYFEKLLSAAAKNRVEVSSCGCADYDEMSERIINHVENKCSGAVMLLNPEKVYNQRGQVVAMRKLYAKNLFKGIRYPIGKIHEDEFVTYKLIFSQSVIAYVDELLYYYSVRPESIMHSKWTPARMDVLEAYEEQIAFFRDSGYINQQKKTVLSMTQKMCYYYYEVEKKSDKKRMHELRNKIKRMLDEYGKRGEGWITFDNCHLAYEVIHPLFFRVYWRVHGLFKR